MTKAISFSFIYSIIKRNLILVFILTATSLMTGCATVVSGSKQDIKITSNPSKAIIYIDGKRKAETPYTTRLTRKKEHLVLIKLNGYYDYEIRLKRKFNAWFIGNIAIGGLIGVIVDPKTGAMYRLSPNEINAEMNKTGTAALDNKDSVYVAVNLTVNPNWEKIGQLEKVH